MPDKALLKVAIEHDPIKVAKELSYDVHRLSPKDIVDKGDYEEGYRFRIFKPAPGRPYPEIIMTRNEREIAIFLKREMEIGNPSVPDKEEIQIIKGMLPLLGISTVVVVAIAVLGRVFTARQIHYQGGQYLVSVRYPGQLNDIREFVQPHNPDVVAVYSQNGPDYWSLFDFVCRNINYRRDVGEFWQTPSETLRGYGDCEDSSNLLTSLLRAGQMPAYTVLGSYQGYGHAWSELNGQILESTYTQARPTFDLEHYQPYSLFNESEVVELWPGALSEVFELGRDEGAKLNLIAKALEAVA